MAVGELIEGRLTNSVIGAFYDAYNGLGYGFYERFCIMALEREILSRGHRVQREVTVPVMYKGEILGRQRLDMVVDEKLVVEVKASQYLHPRDSRQVFNYLRATNLTIGLLFHFGPTPRFYSVIHREDVTKVPGSQRHRVT